MLEGELQSKLKRTGGKSMVSVLDREIVGIRKKKKFLFEGNMGRPFRPFTGRDIGREPGYIETVTEKEK